MEDYDLDATQIRDTPPVQEGGATQVYDREGEAPSPSTTGYPRIAGHYTIHDSLGSGGFAEVYLAEDTRTGRRVALKQLLPGIARHSDIVRRFQSVAERTQALQHPNIIAVFDTEVLEGRLAIVMEYVEGQSLREIMQERESLPKEQRPLAVDKALDIALQLCDALIYAHSNDIIHRDVKPDNILITPQGVVKLGDFDIAKITHSSAVTRAGTRIGTPYYMSPEQLRGQEDVDGRSDVFSIGVVLYEMVTGNLPAGAFKHPSEINPNLPHRLGSVIFKALAYDRGARYGSIRDLRNALTGSPEAQRNQERAFHFRNRRTARTIAELVDLCERDWDSARWHFTSGHFDRWLEVVEPNRAQEIRQAAQDEKDVDLALEQFLHRLDPTLPDPVLAVSEYELDAGTLAPKESWSYRLTVSNPSRGYLVGTAAPDQPWLHIEPGEFRLKEGESLPVIVTAQGPAKIGEHNGQITLSSNGGTVILHSHLQTAARLLFPEAGRSAGDVKELVDLCNSFRPEAVRLFYSGEIEQWLTESMFFGLVSRSQELRQRYGRSTDAAEREKGLWAFVLTCTSDDEGPGRQLPFHFDEDKTATNVRDLVALCEADWGHAQWHLYDGHFAAWLEEVAPALVADVENIRETIRDRSLGLETFLRVLDPDLPLPQPSTDPTEIDLGDAATGEVKHLTLTVSNAGRGYLAGSLIIPKASWVRLASASSGPSEQKRVCPKCGTTGAPTDLHCRKCGQTMTDQPESTAASKQKGGSQSSGKADSSDQKASNTFGCLPGQSHTFDLIAEIPKDFGDKSLAIVLASNAGRVEVPVRVRVARRLLFPEANVSAGSVEELAEIGSRHWMEARSLWSGGQIREWLSRSLRRFDWVALADDLQGRKDLSVDLQLTTFILRVSPESQEDLPPYLEPAVRGVDLGNLLRRTPTVPLRIKNLGGGDPDELRVVHSPTWLDVKKVKAEPAGVQFALTGEARSLRDNGLVQDNLVLELKPFFGGAQLAEQRLIIPVRMRVTNSLKIGSWRIPYDGEARIGSRTVPVRGLWMAAIGLVSLILGVVIGAVAHKGTWTWITWPALWLVGGLLYAWFGLEYRNPIALIRDVVRWMGRQARQSPATMRSAVDWLKALPQKVRRR